MHCLLKMNKPLLFKLWFFFFWSEINKIIKFSEKNLKVVIYGIIIISSKYLCIKLIINIKLIISINKNNNEKKIVRYLFCKYQYI